METGTALNILYCLGSYAAMTQVIAIESIIVVHVAKKEDGSIADALMCTPFGMMLTCALSVWLWPVLMMESLLICRKRWNSNSRRDHFCLKFASICIVAPITISSFINADIFAKNSFWLWAIIMCAFTFLYIRYIKIVWPRYNSHL